MPTVLVYWSPSRTNEEKKALAREFTKALVEHGRARTEDVLIIFQNIEEGDAFRGKQLADDIDPANPEDK